MTTPQLPDPQMDCWDYTFSKSSMDHLWVARDKDDKNQAAVYRVGGIWGYLVASDSEDGIRNAVSSMTGNDPDIMGSLDFEQVSLCEILGAWRFLRYEGRNICVLETEDESVICAQAYPNGPIAPVRNGFLYVCHNRKTGKPLGMPVGDDIVPIASNSIQELVADIQENFNIETEDLLIEHTIVASNLLTASMEHPLIIWHGSVLPLHAIMQLNPNHRPGDPEEDTLDRLA